MQFLDAVKIVFKKYADFRGVATRPEYWWFTLFVFLVTVIASALDLAMRQSNSGPIQMLVSWALLVPQLSVMVRRNRDAGFSAWWLAVWVVVPVAFVAGIMANIETLKQFFEVPDVISPAQGMQMWANLLPVFAPGLISALLIAVFFLVVSLLPSKKRQQPTVATTDY